MLSSSGTEGSAGGLAAPRITGRVSVGTSGWSYAGWDPSFYPEHTPADKRLTAYAERLPTVEIDATFYRLPSEHAITTWRDEVPPGFVLPVKGSRLITHFLREQAQDGRDGYVYFNNDLEGHAPGCCAAHRDAGPVRVRALRARDVRGQGYHVPVTVEP